MGSGSAFSCGLRASQRNSGFRVLRFESWRESWYTKPMNIPKELALVWAAGLFDGEGTITILKNRINVSIHMTDLDILEHMQYHFGGGLYKTAKRQEHHKDAWVWRLTSSVETMIFLEAVYPYLCNRRQERIHEAREAFKNNRNVKNQDKRNSILSLRESGLTQQAIADKVGCSRKLVNRVLRHGDHSLTG